MLFHLFCSPSTLIHGLYWRFSTVLYGSLVLVSFGLFLLMYFVLFWQKIGYSKRKNYDISYNFPIFQLYFQLYFQFITLLILLNCWIHELFFLVAFIQFWFNFCVSWKKIKNREFAVWTCVLLDAENRRKNPFFSRPNFTGSRIQSTDQKWSPKIGGYFIYLSFQNEEENFKQNQCVFFFEKFIKVLLKHTNVKHTEQLIGFVGKFCLVDYSLIVI